MTEQIDDTYLSEEVLALTANFNPFATHISSTRVAMQSHSLSQFQLPINGEFPNIFTGYELQLEKYEHNFSQIEKDIEIIDIIPKYIFPKTLDLDKYVPEYYLIGRRTEDSKLDYYTIKKFQKLNDQFGYKNKIINIDKLAPNNTLKKDIKLYTSETFHNNNEYRFGTNANVVFMTLPENIEDAFIISDELANKLTPDGYETISINIDPDKDFILNTYGNEDDYKIYPDLGSKVNDDGQLLVIRKKNIISLLNDFNKTNINKVNKVLDKIYYIKKNAEIVDIEVYATPNIMNSKKLSSHFIQLKMYHDAKLKSLKQIFDLYTQYSDRYECSRKFNTFMENIMKYLHFHQIKLGNIKTSKKKLKLLNKDVECQLFVNITIKYQKNINIGNKITGRDGAKGVLSNIVPKSMMPTDSSGMVADIVIDPVSVIARNNVGQLLETYINRISNLVVATIDLNKIKSSFNYVMDYIKTISPTYGDIIINTCNSIEDKKEYLQYIKSNGLKLQIKASQKNINLDLIKTLYKKYNTNISPVTYQTYDEFGNIQTTTTKKDVLIGNKFVYLLYNTPSINAVNVGRINVFGVPCGISKNNKLHSPCINESSLRFTDEDNTRILLDTLSSEILYRIRGLSLSYKGIETVVDTILNADKPSDIGMMEISNKELAESDTMVSVIHTIANSFGLDIRNVKLNNKDVEYYNKSVLSLIEEEK